MSTSTLTLRRVNIGYLLKACEESFKLRHLYVKPSTRGSLPFWVRFEVRLVTFWHRFQSWQWQEHQVWCGHRCVTLTFRVESLRQKHEWPNDQSVRLDVRSKAGVLHRPVALQGVSERINRVKHGNNAEEEKLLVSWHFSIRWSAMPCWTQRYK